MSNLSRAGYARWLPLALLVLGTVLNLLTPPDITFVPVFAAVPLVAASLSSFRNTAAIGLLTTAVVAALLVGRHEAGLSDQGVNIATVGTVSLLALGINSTVRRGIRQVASARGVAEAVQRAVLPPPPDRMGQVRVAARYVAAQSDALIGGDLYAAQSSPHGVRLLIADVRGKGLQAAESVAVLLGSFRETAQYKADLRTVARRLDAALARDTARREERGEDTDESIENFATACLVEIPADDTGTLRILNRGHPAPLLLVPGLTPRYLEPSAPALPLGLTGVGGWDDHVDTEIFPPGAQLLLYTDGVSEARDERGTFYDPARGLRGRTFKDPGDLADQLIASVTAFSRGGVHDDIAILAVQQPPRPAHGPLSGAGGRAGDAGGGQHA
ncbi:PP2C family protein-serine/threonine phosphatase [Streptomyces sodiiphilus]|uniref:PP2C family protein-serine/threonine phosphatase n=1 Tax=Streptomyces sodiiphilus TaxID=226217 RepID=UPI0031D47734